jgi:hypothetical protein
VQVVSQTLPTSFEQLRVRACLFTDDSHVKMNPNLGLIRVFSNIFLKFLSTINSPMVRKMYNEFAMFLNCCEKGGGQFTQACLKKD